jgi:formamidopyrimidine-DNA glycosylase
MNLAEIQLIVEDLSILENARMLDFYFDTGYAKHNEFSLSNVFPFFSLQKQKQTYELPTHINKIGRWGKKIIIYFTSCTIVLHMGNKTALILTKENIPVKERENIVCFFVLNDVRGERLFLVYADPLAKGRITVYPASAAPDEFSHLGVDILDSAFTSSYLHSEIAKVLYTTKKEMPIKTFLMRSSAIAGIDNEVISEALHLAGIHPFLNIAELNSFKTACIAKSLRLVYLRMITHLRNDMQATAKIPLKDLYSVYGRAGETCVVCGSVIQVKDLDHHSTFWCPKCQSREASLVIGN